MLRLFARPMLFIPLAPRSVCGPPGSGMGGWPWLKPLGPGACGSDRVWRCEDCGRGDWVGSMLLWSSKKNLSPVARLEKVIEQDDQAKHDERWGRR